MTNKYSRQTLFGPIGEEGQKKFADAHVVIIGGGALGSSSAEMLARSGIGKITIVDRDYVDESNLQRQQLYTESDVQEKLPKAVAAEKRLRQINSDIQVTGIVADITAENIFSFIAGSSVIIDGTDNFETRLIVNDAAVKEGIPFVFGACVASYGLSYTIIPGQTPCLNCLIGHLPADGMTCDTVGVISPIVQQVAVWQVTEVFKLLAGQHTGSVLRTADIWKGEHSEVRVDALKHSACPTCAERSYPFLSYENQTKAAVLCGRNTVQIRSNTKKKMELKLIYERLGKAGVKVKGNPYLVSFEADGCQLVLFQDGRALVHGVKDIARARTIYSKWIG
ncbi:MULTISPECIES: ThiF family adenylyltransferase [Bacillus]|uniref:Thiamine biosynthesis protein MoeB n=2 Tax=Bacillus TaxID=1386 RepID=A0A0M4FVL1_9BACI|nr:MULTISPECIES: ThiF family adenylyltransferase [Bacillus]ALC80763.1 thiamine biosynthesis protein MoeB [Bacillus gobiensis]MBP1079665.1 adenylyltransferase/sulfurtransferase [Bacillus capparidis]MED1095066.1 ThiF family adenylyltransferase [Bacillus capparidis]